MFLTGSVTGDLVTLLATITVILISYWKWTYQYWKKRNVPYLEPKIPYGNLGRTGPTREHIGLRVKRLYDTMKSKGWKHGGIYGLLAPIYLVIDLDYLKNIMTKDFEYFTDRGIYYNEEVDPMSAHLFNLDGPKWRNLRTKLTPTFTSGKMKGMFQTLVDCEENLQKKVCEEYEKGAPLDIKDILGCFTTNIIGSCAFGLDCKTFEDENSPFRVYGKAVFKRSRVTSFRRTFADTFPHLGKLLSLRTHPKEISDFFMKIVKDTVNYRERNQVVRKDFMQLLIDLKNGKQNTVTMNEIVAQSFVFFAAGFETSSTTMSFALYELAKHQEMQEKVRNEIIGVLAKHGKITYDAINDMKYMSQVIDETLRKYPPAALVPRKCVKDYKITNSDVVIEKGTTILIPILGIHHDPEHYPDPEKFDPDRFSEENKASRHSYAHIPFGEGPRICIGMRFGLMQSKVGLTSLLKNFRFTVNQKTQEPLRFDPNSVVLAAEGEIWLDALKI